MKRLITLNIFLTGFALLTAHVSAQNPRDLVYRVPDMHKVLVRSNFVYKIANAEALKADLYLPPNSASNSLPPVIIFVLGDASPDTLRNAKDWLFMQSYGRLAAASGFAAITFNHRSSMNFTRLPEVRGDIADLVSFVRTNAATFSIDNDRLCLWFFSGSGPHLSVAMGTNASFVRCLVAYYPLLAPDKTVSDGIFREFSSYQQLKLHAPNLPPMLLVKAGRDHPRLNAMIDQFRKTAQDLSGDLQYLEHPQGQHAFDIMNDDDTSREIVRKTLAFIQRHLTKTK